jgi:hypothetical protein
MSDNFNPTEWLPADHTRQEAEVRDQLYVRILEGRRE